MREVAKERDSRLTILEGDFRQCALYYLLNDEPVHFVHAGRSLVSACVASALLATCSLGRLCVLGGDDNGVELLRLDGAICLLQIFNSHLRFTIRAQPPELPILAHVGQFLAQFRGHGVRQRHAVFRLVSGIAKHNALVTSPDVKVLLANMNTTGDVWALLVDAHQHFTSLVAEPLTVHTGQVINVRIESDFRNNSTDNLLVVDLGLGRDLARYHYHVVFGCSLAGHLALWISCEASIQHCIRDLIAKLVWVTLIDGFRREEEYTFGPCLLHGRLRHGSSSQCRTARQ
mmetsp:Transcript_4227/g.6453  ORF Transcript_4227/g.6453 Transcript_4227/m.6453 type:complete len:288 (-) Transcript_4227:32-895(-)